MLLPIVLFVLSTLVMKLALAAVVIYCLLPRDHACPACNAETVLLTMPPGLAILARLCRLQRRWCIRCGERIVARGGPEARIWIRSSVRETEAEHLGG